jgi:hypothetical protein
LLDPDDQLFPDARHVERHAIAFAQMMFAHAAFEREVRDLQGSLRSEPYRLWTRSRPSICRPWRRRYFVTIVAASTARARRARLLS